MKDSLLHASVVVKTSNLVVLFRDSLLPRPENGPGTQAGKGFQAHFQGGVRGSPGAGLQIW